MLLTSMSEARKNMHEIINQVCYGGDRAIIQTHGKPCVAIISVDDLKVLEHIEKIVELQEIDKGLAESKAGETINHYDLLKELGIEDEVVRNRVHKEG